MRLIKRHKQTSPPMSPSTSWTVKELRTKLFKRGIRGISRLTKVQLLRLWKSKTKRKIKIKRRVNQKEWTVAKLKQTLAKRGIRGLSGLVKSQLLKLLKKKPTKKKKPIKKKKKLVTKKKKPVSKKKKNPVTKKKKVGNKKKNHQPVTKKVKTTMLGKEIVNNPNKNVVIHGPMSATKHVDPDTGMIIIIFGDVHNKVNSCKYDKNNINLSFVQAMELTARQHPKKIIDLHLEMIKFHYKKNKTSILQYYVRDNEGHLFGDVRRDLAKKGYLRMSHNRVAIPNLRVHNDDVRWLSIPTTLMDIEFLSEEISGQFKQDNAEFLNNLQLLNNLSEYEYLSRFPGDYQFDVEEIYEETKINKQIGKIPPTSKVIPLLEKWKQEFRSDIEEVNELQPFKTIHQFYQLVKTIKKNPKSFNSHFHELQIFAQLLRDIAVYIDSCALLQDIYMLARIMKQQQPSNIVYVGDYHAENLRQGLDEIGFKKIFSSVGSDQCVELSDLKEWPLF